MTGIRMGARMKHHLLIWAAAVALAGSQSAVAQWGTPVGAQPGDWEFRIGPVFTESKNISFSGGSNANVDSTTGVKIGTGWYVSPHLAIGMNFSWAQSNFGGNIRGCFVTPCNPNNPPNAQFEGGHVDFSTLNFDGTYTFLDGPIKPLILAGLGWQWTPISPRRPRRRAAGGIRGGATFAVPGSQPTAPAALPIRSVGVCRSTSVTVSR